MTEEECNQTKKRTAAYDLWSIELRRLYNMEATLPTDDGLFMDVRLVASENPFRVQIKFIRQGIKHRIDYVQSEMKNI